MADLKATSRVGSMVAPRESQWAGPMEANWAESLVGQRANGLAEKSVVTKALKWAGQMESWMAVMRAAW